MTDKSHTDNPAGADIVNIEHARAFKEFGWPLDMKVEKRTFSKQSDAIMFAAYKAVGKLQKYDGIEMTQASFRRFKHDYKKAKQAAANMLAHAVKLNGGTGETVMEGAAVHGFYNARVANYMRAMEAAMVEAEIEL
jgi:hypothetical protein